MRRANGMGSVYKMSHKNLRKPYRAVITIGQDENGKVLRKTVGTFRTGKEAQDFLKDYKGDPAEFTRKEVTFEQCYEWMLADKKRKGVSVKALDGYKTAKGKMKALLKRPIKDIRLADLQLVIDTAKSKSASAMTQITTVFNGVYTAALKNDIEVKNYTKFLIVPPPPEKEKIHKPYLLDEIIDLWNADTLEAKIQLVYIYTGMRPSEIYTQAVDKINLKERYMVGGSKTDAGRNRTIPIANCLVSIISDLFSTAKFKHAKTLGDILPPPKKLNAKIRARGHLPHDGRHTFATLAANYKLDVHCVKLIMGHSLQKDITLDVYTHKNINQLVDAVNLLPDKEKLITVVQRLSNEENLLPLKA